MSSTTTITPEGREKSAGAPEVAQIAAAVTGVVTVFAVCSSKAISRHWLPQDQSSLRGEA
jgi:hypothetical protein